MCTWKSVIILGFFVAHLGFGGQGAQAQSLSDVTVTSSGCPLTNLRIVPISMSEGAIAGDLTMTRGEECDINATWPPDFPCEATSLSWSRGTFADCAEQPQLVDTEIVSPYAARWTLSAAAEGSECSGKIWLYVRNPSTCLTIVLDVTVLEGSEVPEEPPPTVTVDDVILLINSAMLQEELAFLDIKEEKYQDAYAELELALELLEEAYGAAAQLRESSQITIAAAFTARAELLLAAFVVDDTMEFMDKPDFLDTPRAGVKLRANLLFAYAASRRAVEILEGQESSQSFFE